MRRVALYSEIRNNTIVSELSCKRKTVFDASDTRWACLAQGQFLQVCLGENRVTYANSSSTKNKTRTILEAEAG